MDPFITSICAEPDDDLTRLIYADWLDEHGDPRGEFIRLQMATHLGAPGDPLREKELLRLYGRKWAGPLIDWAYDITWRRGFPDHLVLPADVFIDLAEAIFDCAPIRGITLTGAAEKIRPLVRRPELSRLSALHLTGGEIGDSGVTKLANCAALSNLSTLRLGRCWLSSNALADLAGSPHLANLNRLDVPNNAIDGWGIRALAETNYLTRLEALDVRHNDLTAEDIAMLRHSRCLGRLNRVKHNTRTPALDSSDRCLAIAR